MNKATELAVGGGVGVVASEFLKLVIAEAKLVCAFKTVSKELASTMEDMLPIVTQIESTQSAEEVEELKTLTDTIDKAQVLVQECLGVKKWQFHLKSNYTRRAYKINMKMLKFCQVQLQLIMHRNQGVNFALTLEAISNGIETMCKRIDLMDVRGPVYRKLCSVPKSDDKVHIGLDWPLIKLKNKVLHDDSLHSLLVSAHPGCGKTTLVTQICHDQDIKDKFDHIFYCVVSSKPNFRVIVQNLLQHNGYEAVTFENDPQAANALVDLIEELIEDRPILLVLDDVWLGADDLLKYFRIKLPGYKVLVTSRFDLPSFDFKYSLEPLNEKDAKALLVHFAPRPCNASQSEYKELLQKILKRCNGLPLLIKVVGASLRGKPLYLWKGEVESWSEGETVLDSVLHCLQPSFSALKPHRLKECFMDMGSFLEDQKIRASSLLSIKANQKQS